MRFLDLVQPYPGGTEVAFHLREVNGLFLHSDCVVKIVGGHGSRSRNGSIDRPLIPWIAAK